MKRVAMRNKSLYLFLPILLPVLLLFSCSEKATSPYSVQEGAFRQSITESGELAAKEVRSIVMPRYGRYWYEMKITGILDHGTEVQAGDSVLQFDGATIKKFIVEQEARLESEKANLEKKIVEIENRKSDYRSNLMSEQATFDLEKLKLETVRYESDKTRKIKELEFEQAKIRLAKVKRNMQLYEVISLNELKIQKIVVQQIEQRIVEAYDIIDKLTMRTPISGIFQIARKQRSRSLLKIGDEVYAGSSIGNVPDLTWMKVDTYINESDFMKVYEGQKVNVRLDAMHDVVFEGEVSSIGKFCKPIERDSRQKIFDVEVRMLMSDTRLKPGMTVSCEYICADLDNVLHVPISCVQEINGEHFAYVQKAGKITKKLLDVGAANNTRIIIEDGLKKGERLVPVSEVMNQQDKQ